MATAAVHEVFASAAIVLVQILNSAIFAHSSCADTAVERMTRARVAMVEKCIDEGFRFGIISPGAFFDFDLRHLQGGSMDSSTGGGWDGEG